MRLPFDRGIEQAANHALVLCVRPGGFSLEEVHTLFAQGQSHFDALIAKRQFGRRGMKIRNDTILPDGSSRYFTCPLKDSLSLSPITATPWCSWFVASLSGSHSKHVLAIALNTD